MMQLQTRAVCCVLFNHDMVWSDVTKAVGGKASGTIMCIKGHNIGSEIVRCDWNQYN
jgi:hypothetical protein